MIHSRTFTFLLAIVGGIAFSFSASAQNTTAATSATEQEVPPEFSDAFMNDEANIEAGKVVWQKQCRHCHGYSAYPGKAPKLKPKRYEPEFVFKRVTNGFRKMPGWKAVFSRAERMAVVSYILSKQFSP